MTDAATHPIVELAAPRKGHFELESGHHGELWLELDCLFQSPARLAPFVASLAGSLSRHRIDAVCGPTSGGAFLALLIAKHLSLEFLYSEKQDTATSRQLYAAKYALPEAQKRLVRGKRIALVDDVINAGSAIRSTLGALDAGGAQIVAFGALLVLGSRAAELAASRNVSLERVAELPTRLWTPAECPLCRSSVPLEQAD